MTEVLKFVTHDAVNNTLEVTWVDMTYDADGAPLQWVNTRVRNYTVDQSAEFTADVGTVPAQKYLMIWGLGGGGGLL